jgi:glutaredoxin
VKFVMYSKDGCPWCDRAKDLITAKGDEYEEFKIGRELTREEFTEQFPNVRTVPYIILNNDVIGGFESLQSHYDARVA